MHLSNIEKRETSEFELRNVTEEYFLKWDEVFYFLPNKS